MSYYLILITCLYRKLLKLYVIISGGLSNNSFKYNAVQAPCYTSERGYFMRRILVVCYGNTCRSPMAQAIVATMLKDTAHVKSAGMEAASDMPATKEAFQVMKDKGNSQYGTAHFSPKEYRRRDYSRRVKKIWAVMGKRSKMRVTKIYLKPPKRDIDVFLIPCDNTRSFSLRQRYYGIFNSAMEWPDFVTIL